MGWKKFAKTEKGASGQVECESHIDSFLFDIEGVVHHEFLRQGRTVNCWYHLEVLKCLSENVRKKRPQLWRNNWFFHHDNVPAHASLLIRDFLANTNTTVLPQPPYSPDLAPADFFLFPKLKSTLKEQRFQTTQVQKICRWSYAQSQKRCIRTVSRSGNSTGSGTSMQEWSTLKATGLTQLHVCPKKLQKIVPTLFEQTTYEQ
jgi:transposase